MRTAIILGFAILLALGWYLSFTASRLDRLHHRVESASASLDAQLVRRAQTAIELATSGLVDPASGLLVAAAASDALESGERQHGGESDLHERETTESDLSEALREAFAEPDSLAAARSSGIGEPLVGQLATAVKRAELARRFHNQAVGDVQRVRRKRVVRWAHLAGRAALPETFEIDDEAPAALRQT